MSEPASELERPALPQNYAPVRRFYTPEERRQRLLKRQQRISLVVRQSFGNRNAFVDALEWWMPWNRFTFPGLRLAILTVLGNRVTWQAVQHWRTERRPLPQWAADAFADQLEARARSALEIAFRLRAMPSGPGRGKPTGFVVVRDGADRRRARVQASGLPRAEVTAVSEVGLAGVPASSEPPLLVPIAHEREV